jgi:antirestriction protein ArdC
MATTARSNNVTFKDTYQEVTDTVIKALEEGTVIWQSSWNDAGLPKNITTGINYRGWIVYWATIELKNKAANNNEEQPTATNIDEKQRTKLVPKAHTVFNIAQTEDIEFPTITPIIKSPLQKIAACEQVAAHMPNSQNHYNRRC